jgi:hypothetical protein
VAGQVDLQLVGDEHGVCDGFDGVDGVFGAGLAQHGAEVRYAGGIGRVFWRGCEVLEKVKAFGVGFVEFLPTGSKRF